MDCGGSTLDPRIEHGRSLREAERGPEEGASLGGRPMVLGNQSTGSEAAWKDLVEIRGCPAAGLRWEDG